MCLCSCTPCEGIHAQVTSQRGSGAPGKIPGVLHTGEGDRSFSGILRTGEENRKNWLPGLDPRTDAMASHSAVSFEHGEGEDDYLQQEVGSPMRMQSMIGAISQSWTMTREDQLCETV